MMFCRENSVFSIFKEVGTGVLTNP